MERKDIVKFMKDNNIPENIIEHGIQTCDLALKIGQEMEKPDPGLHDSQSGYLNGVPILGIK